MATISSASSLSREEAMEDPKVWIKRNGSQMYICDMDDNHLLNSIAMLERGADADGNRVLSTIIEAKYQCLLSEALNRGCLENDGWDT